MEKTELRKELQTISGKPIEEHINLVLVANEKFASNIKFVEKSFTNKNYTCFCYALALSREDPRMIRQESVYEMIKDGVLVEDDSGKIIIYFDESKTNSVIPTHAGLFINKRVISKWGSGHVWNHEVLDVPENYKSEFKNYHLSAPDKAADYYTNEEELESRTQKFFENQARMNITQIQGLEIL